MRTRVSVSILLSVVFTIFCGVCPRLMSAQTAAPQRTLIRAGHLLDVHTGKTLDAQTIVVSGNRIVSIAPTASTPPSSGDAVMFLALFMARKMTKAVRGIMRCPSLQHASDNSPITPRNSAL